MMLDIFDIKYEQLKIEWQMCSDGIRSYDKLIFTIRGWIISLTTAILAYAFSEKSYLLPIFVIVPVLMFWFIDALYKNFQLKFISRSKEIEGYLSSEQFQLDFKNKSQPKLIVPLLSSQFGAGTIGDRLKDVLYACVIRNVLITYIFLIMMCIFSYLIILCM